MSRLHRRHRRQVSFWHSFVRREIPLPDLKRSSSRFAGSIRADNLLSAGSAGGILQHAWLRPSGRGGPLQVLNHSGENQQIGRPGGGFIHVPPADFGPAGD